MATLFDQLQERLANPEQPTPSQEQEGIARILRAKGGKAGSGGGAKASAVGEGVAQQGVNAAVAQQGLAGSLMASQIGAARDAQATQTATAEADLAATRRIAEEGMATQAAGAREQIGAQTEISAAARQANEEMKTAAINAQATNQLRALMTQRGITLDDIFANFKQSSQELEFREDAAQLEQFGFNLALSDKTYMDELSRIGRQRNMDSELAFQAEMNDIILGADLSETMDELGFAKKFGAQQREWEKTLTEMGADAKIELARAMIRDDAKRRTVEGIGSAVGAAAGAAAENPEWFESQSTDTPVTNQAEGQYRYGGPEEIRTSGGGGRAKPQANR